MLARWPHSPGSTTCSAATSSASAGGSWSTDAVGLGFEALVFATMRRGDRDTVAAFEEAVTAIPHVVLAQRLFGDPDYLLRVVSADLRAFQRLYDERLATLPGVRRLTSTLVMKQVVGDRPLIFTE